MVGNGDKTQCSSLRPNISVSIQKHSFIIPLYLLPIEGANVVLGMDGQVL